MLKFEDLEINITEKFELYVLREIVTELERMLEHFDTRAMSDHKLYLEGRKSMLADIILYFERVMG